MIRFRDLLPFLVVLDLMPLLLLRLVNDDLSPRRLFFLLLPSQLHFRLPSAVPCCPGWLAPLVQPLADIVQRLLDVAPVVYSALLVVVLLFEGCAFLVVVFDLFVVIGDFSGLFASAQFRIPFLSFLLFLLFSFCFVFVFVLISCSFSFCFTSFEVRFDSPTTRWIASVA